VVGKRRKIRPADDSIDNIHSSARVTTGTSPHSCFGTSSSPVILRPEDTRSERAMSIGSAASCSSYIAFGPRKGRRVAYDAVSPANSSGSVSLDFAPREPVQTDVQHGMVDCEEHIYGETYHGDYETTFVRLLFDADSQAYPHPMADIFGGIQPSYDEKKETNRAQGSQVPVVSIGDSSHPKRILYQCTFCGKDFPKRWTWQRHEEALHAPPQVWVCESSTYDKTGSLVFCPICEVQTTCTHDFISCWQKPVHQRTFHRLDNFVQHLKGPHSAGTWAREGLYQSKSVVTPVKALPCPFCVGELPDWGQRVLHVASHFENGDTLPSLVGPIRFENYC